MDSQYTTFNNLQAYDFHPNANSSPSTMSQGFEPQLYHSSPPPLDDEQPHTSRTLGSPIEFYDAKLDESTDLHSKSAVHESCEPSTSGLQNSSAVMASPQPQFSGPRTAYHTHSMPSPPQQYPGQLSSGLDETMIHEFQTPIFNDLFNLNPDSFNQGAQTNDFADWTAETYEGPPSYPVPHSQLMSPAGQHRDVYVPERIQEVMKEFERYRQALRHNRSENEKLIQSITVNEQSLELWANQIVEHLRGLRNQALERPGRKTTTRN